MSKSFIAQLPLLRDAELERLRRWGEQNCAESVLRPDDSCIMWHCARERARTREDFARAVRGTFKRLGLDATLLKKGHWLTLTSADVVRAEAGTTDTSGITQEVAESMADKVIQLSAPRDPADTSLMIVKEG